MQKIIMNDGPDFARLDPSPAHPWDHIKFNESPKFKEVTIYIGHPRNGKSTFCETVLVSKNYIRINQYNFKNKNNLMKKN